jgi:hypothetical protein
MFRPHAVAIGGLLITAMLGAMASGAVADGASLRSTCATIGHTVQANAVARVFSLHPGGSFEYHACVYGQRRNLGYFGPRGRVDGVSGVELRGPYLGMVLSSTDCEHGYCGRDHVIVRDLRRPRGPAPGLAAASYVLSDNGSFAVIGLPDPAGQSAVIAVVRGRPRTLDSGAITAGSLALAGRTLYWTRDGIPRSAPLA